MHNLLLKSRCIGSVWNARFPNEFSHLAKSARLSLLLLLVALFLVTPRQVPAQTPSPTATPTEEEIKLQEQKQILDLQKAIAEDQKAIRDAQPTPAATPAVTPLVGEATLEGVRLESEMLSYAAMSQVAAEISREIRQQLPKSDTTIAVFDAQVVKDWRFYQALLPAFAAQVDDILNAYRDILCGASGLGSDAFKARICPDYKPHTFRAMDRAMLTSVPESFNAGAGLLKSFIDFAALFRTDVKIEGASVTIDDSALVAEVFRALHNEFVCWPNEPATEPCDNHLHLYYPGMFPPRLQPGATPSTTVAKIGLLYLYKQEADQAIKRLSSDKQGLLDSIQDKLALKSDYQSQLAPVKDLTEKKYNLINAISNEHVWAFKKKFWEELKQVNAELAKYKYSVEELKALIKQLDMEMKPTKDEIDKIDDQVKSLTDLNDRFSAFIEQFVKVDQDKGVNTLALFIKSEDIDEIMNKPQSYWLEVKSVSAGGNNRTRKNLIWFFTGPRIDHSGGAIIEYTLYDQTGAVFYSDKRAYYKGYVKPKDIRNGKLKDAVRDPVPYKP